MIIGNDFKQLDSKSGLESFLEKEKLPYLILGSDSEAPREFYAIQIIGYSGKHLAIGIIASGSGIRPSYIYSIDKKYCVIGYDTSIDFLDTDNLRSPAQIQLDGVFYGFITCGLDDEFIAVNELGAARFRSSGEEVWSVSTDILERWQKRSDRLFLFQQDKKEFVVDINNGKLLEIEK